MDLGFQASPWALYALLAIIAFIFIGFILVHSIELDKSGDGELAKRSKPAKEPDQLVAAAGAPFQECKAAKCRNVVLEKEQDKMPAIGKIIFFITAFYACAVVGVFLAEGTSFVFGIFTSEPLMSGIASGLLSLIEVTLGFVIFKKRKFRPQPLMGLSIILSLSVTYGMAAYIGPGAESVLPGMTEVQNEAAQTISMAQEAIWPLIPFVIAVFCTIAALKPSAHQMAN